MIDRLPELRKLANFTDLEHSQENFEPANTYEQQHNKEGIDDDFFEDVKSVRELNNAMNTNNYKIQQLKGKYAKAIKSTQEKQNSAEMNQILAENAEMHQIIKEKISDLKDRVEEDEKNKPDEPETKMKRNFYLSLSKEVTDVLQKQQSSEDQFKNSVKEKVVRQVRLIDPEIGDDQVHEYINDPELAQQMLSKKILGQASTTLKNTVSDIQDKFRDIKMLEASVTHCLQLFNELSVLVMAQGETIDSIEANVAKSKHYVEEGEKKLVKAKEHHKWSKKCKCIVIIVGLVILIIVIIIIATTASRR